MFKKRGTPCVRYRITRCRLQCRCAADDASRRLQLMPIIHATIKDQRFFHIVLVPYPRSAVSENRIHDRSIL